MYKIKKSAVLFDKTLGSTNFRNNSGNHVIIYHRQTDSFVDWNMMIVIVLMCYMLNKTGHYLNGCINY
jgi:hypothetical protein